MRSLIRDNNGSAVPVILFVVTLIAVGALYTLLFIEICIPTLGGYIPASDSKTLIMMFIYAMPLTVLLVGIVSLMLAGVKRNQGVGL